MNDGRSLAGGGGVAGGRRMAALAAALLALPVVVVAVLSVRAIEGERMAARRALEARAQSFARDTAAVLADQIERVTAAVAADVALRLARADMEPADALRRATLDRVADQLVLSEGGRRLFPAEDAAAMLLQEQAMMHWLGPVLARLGEGTDNDGSGDGEWVRTGNGATRVSCRRLAPDRRLCLGLPLDRLLAMSGPLSGSEEIRLMALIDPWGVPRWLEPAAREPAVTGAEIRHEVRVTGALDGWTLRVALAPPPAGRLGGWLLAMVAGVVGSGGLVWGLMRRQARIAEERQARIEAAARLSHDLRTPLANIRLYLDLIARQAVDQPAVRRACAVAEQEAERLQVIAIDAVRRARGEAAATDVAAEPVEADEAVAAQVSRFETALGLAGCRLTVRLDADGARIAAAGLERILGNLFDNVRRHAPGSRVEVTTTTEADQFVVRVENHDGGAVAVTPCTEGFGMGLEVARALAAAAGGSLAGVADDTGAAFTLRLPLAGGPA